MHAIYQNGMEILLRLPEYSWCWYVWYSIFQRLSFFAFTKTTVTQLSFPENDCREKKNVYSNVRG